jgi:ATP-dependent DNA helicase pcrA
MAVDMIDNATLTIEQQEAIMEIERNLQIIACAGSGKTEVITRRIANILNSRSDIKPENIVAFTFTEKAAESMRKRIENILGSKFVKEMDKMYIGTIHGFCYRILTKYTEKFKEYRVLDTAKSYLFISRYSIKCGIKSLGLEPWENNIDLFLKCIDKMIDNYDHIKEWTHEQRNAFEKYTNCLYSNNYIDFSLIIFETLQQIDTNIKVCEYLSQIKYLVVDEYQDVNDLQERLISYIGKLGANLCVVGDDDQTIYQFRGSNANNIISFSSRYENVHQVRLEKNFRSSHGIVDVAESVIHNNKNRITKKMASEVLNMESTIMVKRYLNKEKQFYAIAEKVKKIHLSGIPYKEIAILVRKRKIIPYIVEALEYAQIPYETDGVEKFFKNEYFNRFIITLQTLIDIDKAKLYECWNDIVDKEKFNSGFRYLRRSSREARIPLKEIMVIFCEKICFLDDNADDIEIRRIYFDGILKILSDYDEIYGDRMLTSRVDGVLTFIENRATDRYSYKNFNITEKAMDMVQIMTIHKSKGLEFNTVFLPELQQGEFPASNMGGTQYYHVLGGFFEENKHKYQSDLEDERKLFYVAVTRAKQNLFMSYELLKGNVSCFVKEALNSKYVKIDTTE